MRSSERKIAANRNNAKKSTGPRSNAGRQVSRRNALRHGLAVAIGSDPAFSGDVQKLAIAISCASGSRNVSETACQAAEAELELMRVRKIRASLFETYYFGKSPTPDPLAELNDKLAKLERYERRAFARRNCALRALS